MEPRISIVTLGVRDLQRAVAFYRDGVHFPISSASTDDVAFFRTGGVVLALWSRELLAADARLSAAGSGFSGIALAHNVRNRDEVDAVLAQAAAAGGKILRPGQAADWGGYTGYFADPDGFPWEVAWNPDFPMGSDGRLELP